MVIFACNHCGDSLKKNKVEQHSWQCRTKSISCIDCLKDFSLTTYSSHLECISEDQKYGGLNYKPPEQKGKNKQNAWIQKIKDLIENNQYPRDVQNILKSLVNYDNIPRKKAKFVNFVKNSFRIRDEVLIGKVWDVFETSIKDSNQAANNNHNVVNNGNQVQAIENNNEQTGSKRKLENDNQDNVENSISDKKLKNSEKIKMKNVVKEIIVKYNEISINKLQKKVLKYYLDEGYTNESDIIEKFEKVINKPKFTIDNNKISISN